MNNPEKQLRWAAAIDIIYKKFTLYAGTGYKVLTYAALLASIVSTAQSYGTEGTSTPVEDGVKGLKVTILILSIVNSLSVINFSCRAKAVADMYVLEEVYRYNKDMKRIEKIAEIPHKSGSIYYFIGVNVASLLLWLWEPNSAAKWQLDGSYQSLSPEPVSARLLAHDGLKNGCSWQPDPFLDNLKDLGEELTS
jgi:hypothetical protein